MIKKLRVLQRRHEGCVWEAVVAGVIKIGVSIGIDAEIIDGCDFKARLIRKVTQHLLAKFWLIEFRNCNRFEDIAAIDASYKNRIAGNKLPQVLRVCNWKAKPGTNE